MTVSWPAGEAYRGRTVLVTGGLGFMGLNLVTALVAMGAQVRILSRSWPPSSGVLSHLLHGVQFSKGDLRDETAVDEAVQGSEFVFNLAGKAGPAASNAAPFEDLDVNGRGQLVLLEACRRLAPQAVIVFSSSRLVYAPTQRLPVDESAELGPLSIYGVHKLTAEHYHRIYQRLYGLRSVILRITNPYGRFQRPEQNRYGIINWFIHLAVNGEPLPVYGDGAQLRDYVHVQDVVRAFLLAGASESAAGQTLNVGGGKPVSFQEMAQTIVRAAKRGQIKSIPWPPEAAKVETGDFAADIRKIDSLLGWRPTIGPEEGITDVVRQYERAGERLENWSEAISS
jgi:UDP-glucose 4-epimerase